MHCLCVRDKLQTGGASRKFCPKCNKVRTSREGLSRKRKQKTVAQVAQVSEARPSREGLYEDDFSFKNPIYRKKYLKFEPPVKRLKFAAEGKFITLNPKNIAALTQALNPVADPLRGITAGLSDDDKLNDLKQKLNDPTKYSAQQLQQLEKEYNDLINKMQGEAKPSSLAQRIEYTPQELFDMNHPAIKASLSNTYQKMLNDFGIQILDNSVYGDMADKVIADLLKPKIDTATTLSQYQAIIDKFVAGDNVRKRLEVQYPQLVENTDEFIAYINDFDEKISTLDELETYFEEANEYLDEKYYNTGSLFSPSAPTSGSTIPTPQEYYDSIKDEVEKDVAENITNTAMILGLSVFITNGAIMEELIQEKQDAISAVVRSATLTGAPIVLSIEKIVLENKFEALLSPYTDLKDNKIRDEFINKLNDIATKAGKTINSVTEFTELLEETKKQIEDEAAAPAPPPAGPAQPTGVYTGLTDYYNQNQENGFTPILQQDYKLILNKYPNVTLDQKVYFVYQDGSSLTRVGRPERNKTAKAGKSLGVSFRRVEGGKPVPMDQDLGERMLAALGQFGTGKLASYGYGRGGMRRPMPRIAGPKKPFDFAGLVEKGASSLFDNREAIASGISKGAKGLAGVATIGSLLYLNEKKKQQQQQLAQPVQREVYLGGVQRFTNQAKVAKFRSFKKSLGFGMNQIDTSALNFRM